MKSKPLSIPAGYFATLAPLFAICFFCQTPQALASQELSLSMRETVRQADAIVLGTVTAKQSRWGDATRRWMATDYQFSVERVIYASPQNGAINDTLSLTYWGGTIDGQAQAISDVRLPAIGERLILMLRPDWGRQAGFTPVLGLNQGLFVVDPPAGGTESVRDAAGVPLALGPGSQPTRRTSKSLAQAPNVNLTAFLAWVQANVSSIKAGPSELPPFTDSGAPRLMAKTPSFSPGAPAGGTASPLIDSPANAPAALPVSAPASSAQASQALPEQPQVNPNYITNHQAHLPIVVNDFPASFAPWSPEDQYQMSKWNYYATDVFRVYTTPTGTYGWPNGVFDLDGWPSSSDLMAVYGSGWDSNTIGVTFLNYDGGGWIIEADIAFNPAFSYTLDDEWVYDGGTAQGFRQVMIHELGHMHGLEHQFYFLAVMNYMPGEFRFFGIPYMDDAAGIRFEYPTQVVSIADLAVYLYYEVGYQDVTDATYPSTIAAGDPITVSNYHVENVGTATISDPTIEWYLSSARNYNGYYVYLGTQTFSSLDPFTYFTPSSVSATFTVPAATPPGYYYLGAFIREDAGAGQSSFPFSNNYAFSRNTVWVSAPLESLTVFEAGAGGGTVSSAPAGIDCGAICSASFDSSTTVTLTAGAATGSLFAGWNGEGCGGTGTCVVSMTQARYVTATFNLIPTGPGNTTHFAVITPSSATAGRPIRFTVQALDSSNQVDPTYKDPVHFDGNGASVTLPADSTLSNGAGSFSASFGTQGVGSITASDPNASQITGPSGNIQVTASTAGLRFVSMHPCRVADTRVSTMPAGFGPPSLVGGATRSFTIPAGSCGIPDNAQAYALNVTVVPQDDLGYLTVWPAGQSKPTASTLNSLDGRVKANAAIVPAGTAGAISVYATDDTELVLDIDGYFVPASQSNGLGFYPMTPCRLVDTRLSSSSTIVSGSLPAGSSTTLPILSSKCHVPATAEAYSLNITAMPQKDLGFLTLYPAGSSRPAVSTLNDPTGTVVANAAIAPAGTGGSLVVYVTDQTDLLVDINGYFAPVTEGALSLYTEPPCRVLDTRLPSGSPPFTGLLNVDVIGSICGGTTTAQAYVFNATVVPPAFLGYLTLWPEGSTQPAVSTLNAYDGEITSNMAIVPTHNTGISAFVNAETHLVLDVFGYFAP